LGQEGVGGCDRNEIRHYRNYVFNLKFLKAIRGTMGIIAVREIIIHPGTLEGHSQNNGDYRTIIELNVYIG
jgi:hypothetical protein